MTKTRPIPPLPPRIPPPTPPSEAIRWRRGLSNELIELGILPYLPAISLLRFQSVSRRWRDLISNPYFIRLHSKIHRTLPPGILCTEKGKPPGRMFEPELPSSLAVTIEGSGRRSREQFQCVALTIFASSRGLVCLSGHDLGLRKWDLFVGNPLLRDWKLISDPPFFDYYKIFSFEAFGMVVDSSAYKLVAFDRTEFVETGFNQVFHVFTSSTGSWETIKERVDSPSYRRVWPTRSLFDSGCRGEVACLRGILYWVCTCNHLLWFDAEEKQSGYQALPSRADARSSHQRCSVFGEWNGELSYCRIMTDDIEIWSMTDRRDPCWTKMHSLSLDSIVRENLCFAGFDKGKVPNHVPFAVVAHVGGNVIFSVGRMMYAYNLKTREAHNLFGSSCFDFSWFSYQTSLVPSPNLGK